jgi:hypothetical protein
MAKDDFKQLAEHLMQADEFVANETKYFIDRTLGNEIKVEIQNDTRKFRWRMTVTGPKGEQHARTSSNYQGLLEVEGYLLATAYYEGVFPEFIPFRTRLIPEA